MVLALFAAALGGSVGSSLSVSAEPVFVSGSGIGSFSQTVASNAVTLTVFGGAGPYGYNWVRQSGDENILAAAPSSAATNFYAADVPVGTAYRAQFHATVTDSLGATASIDISVFIGGGSVGSSLSVSAEPGFASGGGIGSFSQTVASNTVTLTAFGGAGPYGYNWVRQSGDVNILAAAPSSAETNFYAADVPVGTTYIAQFSATVTDSLFATVSIDVTVNIENVGA